MTSPKFLPILTRHASYCQSKGSIFAGRTLPVCSRSRQPWQGRVLLNSTLQCRYYNSAAIPARESFDEEKLASSQTFPSIIIAPQGRIEPLGSFAEAQAQVSDIVCWLYFSHETA
jgi:hypothetical protein